MDLLQLFNYGFIQQAFLAASLMSVACGIIGTYIVSRRMVFISGGITHASFGGIGIGYFFGFPPLAGAALFAVLAALTTENLTRRKVLRNDSIIAIMWSLGMALGIIFVYLTPGYAPNLMSFLFGSIITVTIFDLWLMFSLVVVVSVFFALLFKPILYVAFDEQFARTRGIPVMLLNYMLIILVALRTYHPSEYFQPFYQSFQPYHDRFDHHWIFSFCTWTGHFLLPGYSLGCNHYIHSGSNVLSSTIH